MPNIYLLRLIGKDFKFIMYKYRIILSAHLIEHRVNCRQRNYTEIATHVHACMFMFIPLVGVFCIICIVHMSIIPVYKYKRICRHHHLLHYPCVGQCVFVHLYKYNLTYRGHHRNLCSSKPYILIYFEHANVNMRCDY